MLVINNIFMHEGVPNLFREQPKQPEKKPSRTVDEVVTTQMNKFFQLSAEPVMMRNSIQQTRDDFESMHEAAVQLAAGEPVPSYNQDLLQYYPGFKSEDFAKVLEQLPDPDATQELCLDLARKNPDEIGKNLADLAVQLEHIGNLDFDPKESALAAEAYDDLMDALQTSDPSTVDELLKQIAANRTLWVVTSKVKGLRSLIALLPELPPDTWSRTQEVIANTMPQLRANIPKDE